MKIAGKLTIRQWKELDKKLNNEEAICWEYAFSFFEERIKTRYLKPIEAILNMKDNIGEGFAVVNLQCSLIETIECFVNGWIYDKHQKGKHKWYSDNDCAKYSEDNVKSKTIFKSFFENREPFKKMFEENNLEGNDFYRNVRCGLLHETQTKNGWRIKVSNKDNAKSITNDKIIYRENFHRDINNVIENYKSTIVEGKPFDDNISVCNLRQNFIIKINHICKQS